MRPKLGSRISVAVRRGRSLRYATAGVALVLLLFAGDRALHQGQVLRGVRIGDVSLGGLDGEQARAALALWGERLTEHAVLVAVRDRRFEVTGDEVGFSLDVDALVSDAMRTGRDGNPLQQLAWWLGRVFGDHEVAARGNVDLDRVDPLLEHWASAAIDDPPFEGAVMASDGHPVGKVPRSGWVIDQVAACEALASGFAGGGGTSVVLPITERAPRRSAVVVERAVEEARRLLAAPVTLVASLADDELLDDDGWLKSQTPRSDADPGEPRELRVEITPAALGAALQTLPVDDRPPSDGAADGSAHRSDEATSEPGLSLLFDPALLEPALREAREKIEAPARNARFVIGERDQVYVRPSRPGRVLDMTKVAEAVLVAARAESRQALLPIDDGDAPTFSTEDARLLRIAGLVSQFTTDHPCCRPRVKNIHTIADLIDGVVVKPGETFSINEHVGPRTQANGFVAAPTIVEGEMEDTLGGGVSQFATTFFNAAFYGGYEIIERQPHSFYFRRYPMGHEATLSFPKPDVVIRNDTAAGLLIRCVYTEGSITVKLFGDNAGRKVFRRKSAPIEVTKPPVEYVGDKSLDPERQKVKDRGQMGWSIVVGRVLEYPDGTQKKEQRKVTYKPRPRKIRVHPCRIPKGAKGWTGERCPEPEEADSPADVEDVPAILGPDDLQGGPETNPEATPEG